MTLEEGCDPALLLAVRGGVSGSAVSMESAWYGEVSSLDLLPSLLPPEAWSEPEFKVSICEVT